MAIKIPVVGMDNHKGSDVRFLSFSRQPWLTTMVSDYIEFEPYDATRTYAANTVFFILAGVYREVRDQFRDRKAIIDVCLEARMPMWDELYTLKEPHHAIMYGSYCADSPQDVIHVPNFFWYNESLLYLARGYDQYQPARNYKHKFLMPIGRKVKWRDKVVEMLEPYLDDAYWSYVRRGRALPGEPADTAGAKRWDTRRQSPYWYNDTCFSMVLESITQWDNAVVFVTEKTWKPVSHQHPFMIIGAPGILQYVKSQGFETFDNLFDEDYDNLKDLDAKMKLIATNIDNFQKAPYDALTLDKLKHNHNLFYNKEKIRADVVRSFVEPIERYINT